MAAPPMYVQVCAAGECGRRRGNVNDSGTVVIVLKGDTAVVVELVGVTTGVSVV